MVRPQDMLVVDFDFHNLRPDLDADPPVLRRIDPAQPCFVVVRFDSQHVTEQTVYEKSPTSGERPAPGAAAAKAVGPSRIAFVVPGTVKTIPYSETGLLRWWQWIMRVVPGAGRPEPLQTDLLVVDWLHLTPEQIATWDHAEAPVEHGGRTELWHTRLAPRAADGRPDPARVPTVRVVAADDLAPEEAELFRALRPPEFDHRQLITLTNPGDPVSAPVHAGLLALSAAGATVDLDGRWEPSPTPGLNLRHWEHHAWLGRDNKVVLEQYGFLVPFGHRALLITETKRTFDDETGVAYLEQRQFVRITEPAKDLKGAHGQRFQGRALPFTEVVIETTALPDLPRERDAVLPGHPDKGFWIQDIATGADVAFSLRATGPTGREARFTASLGFVLHDVAVQEPRPGTLLRQLIDTHGGYDRLTGAAPDRRRVIDLHGQEIAYAAEAVPGTASHPTNRLFWGLQGPRENTAPHVDSPLFYPWLMAAEAQVPAVDTVYGGGGTLFVHYDDKYLADDFTGNAGEVYLRVQDSVESIADPEADRPVARLMDNSAAAGGVAMPHLGIGGMSRSLGPVSGKKESVENVRDRATVVPKDYFDFDGQLRRAVLFGGTFLANVLDDGEGGRGTPLSGALHVKKETLYPPIKEGPDKGKPDTGKAPIGHEMKLDWTAKLKSYGPFYVDPAGPPATLKLECVNKVDYVEDTHVNTVTGRISRFEFQLVDPEHKFIGLVCEDFGFSYELFGDPKFDHGIKKIRFYGVLNFVNALEDLISDAFGKTGKSGSGGIDLGIKIKVYKEVDSKHAAVGLTVDLPTIPIGPILTIEHAALSAGVILPFDAKPVRAAFSFAREDAKFSVTVYGFGGAGYFSLEVSEHGVEKLDAAIEAHYSWPFDLVVASGLAKIAFGVSYHMKRADSGDSTSKDTVTLSGYVTATGRISVLGLISIMAEFHADLTYEEVGDQSALTAHARLVVSIDILFFHESVGLEFSWTIAGGIADDASGLRSAGTRRALDASEQRNGFGDRVSREDWELYCDSFAP